MMSYAADTWNKTADGTWKYIGTEVDGEQGQFGSMVHSYSSINILGYTSPRFGIITGMMRNYMSKKLPEEYSVVTRKIVRPLPLWRWRVPAKDRCCAPRGGRPGPDPAGRCRAFFCPPRRCPDHGCSA